MNFHPLIMASTILKNNPTSRAKSSNLLFAFVLFLSLCSFATMAQTTSLTGTVKTSDGKRAEAVTIFIQAINRGTTTNDRGTFILHKLPVGTYKVVAKSVGLQSQELDVTLVTGQTGSLSFVLTETSSQLAEVNVSASKANKFANKKSDYVARMPLENLENPQVYTAISKELINEQIIVDFKEALRNAPGVIPNNNPAGGTGGSIRGFNATTTVRNGMAVQSYQSDPINIERIEVIKGPSGTLFGTNIVGFGGLINQVTKKPLDTLTGEVGVTVGKYQLSRITADINTPLNADKTALLRINAATHREASFQNYGHKRMVTFAPSFAYKVSDKLSFLLEAEINKTNRSTVAYHQNLNNTPYKNFRDIPIAFNVSLGGSDIDAQLSATNVYGEAKYKMSDEWTSITSVAYGENQIDHSNQIYPQWVTDATTKVVSFNRTISNYGPRIFTSLNAQQNFIGDFKIGNFRNRVVAGANFYNYRSFLKFTSVGTYDVVTPSANTPIPAIFIEKVNAILAAKTPSNTENTQSAVSAYASDVFNVTDNLSAMFSLRIDRFTNDPSVTNGIVSGAAAYSQTAFSPKLGLTYQVIKDQISVFGNYMNGFQNVGPVTQPTGVEILKPRQANQIEGGVKLEVFDKKLNATFSYYDIKISKDTRQDNGFTIQDATSKSKGFEAEVIANPIQGLNIIAGYATNSYKIINAAAAAIGKYQAQTPTKFGNLWVSYKFTGSTLRNVGLGFGGNYVADCFFDATNEIVIPAYTVVNGSLFYDQPKWRLGFKANNIGNKQYWTNYGIAETLSQYIGSVTFKF
jgi:iron complex outermembrane receptor protein